MVSRRKLSDREFQWAVNKIKKVGVKITNKSIHDALADLAFKKYVEMKYPNIEMPIRVRRLRDLFNKKVNN